MSNHFATSATFGLSGGREGLPGRKIRNPPNPPCGNLSVSCAGIFGTGAQLGFGFLFFCTRDAPRLAVPSKEKGETVSFSTVHVRMSLAVLPCFKSTCTPCHFFSYVSVTPVAKLFQINTHAKRNRRAINFSHSPAASFSSRHTNRGLQKCPVNVGTFYCPRPRVPGPNHRWERRAPGEAAFLQPSALPVTVMRQDFNPCKREPASLTVETKVSHDGLAQSILPCLPGGWVIERSQEKQLSSSHCSAFDGNVPRLQSLRRKREPASLTSAGLKCILKCGNLPLGL